MAPTYIETRKIIEEFRSASTHKEKVLVVKGIRKKYPEIAKRLTVLIEEDRKK